LLENIQTNDADDSNQTGEVERPEVENPSKRDGDDGPTEISR
jgi:hypothetical protein